MARAFSEIAFTKTVRAIQEQNGSRRSYAPLDDPEIDPGNRFTTNETRFVEARDGFYQATISETGWPYVQFRGGPIGFLKVLDPTTLAYADYRGNRQYISTGNLTDNRNVCLFLMDYPNRTRLKIWATAEQVPLKDNENLLDHVHDSTYRALPERIIRLKLQAFDWNCPQHIPQRFTLADLAPGINELRSRIRELEEENEELKSFLNTKQPVAE
ncbi:pyridoxamine 5'-phosphate oxidase family protein [Labrenzia sp. PHM005]|uniref:pyridoxamine 5'-phosphate oxidase family protein n=1 Tax=Labrenzia sp. PHM005 TaxID=2590016 RepID=UPI00114035F7|nr:pyridoxamine 5'-phosphate oxidase family protein [Labrenzia sp. PHM005]QDG77889.1 pyridoxamine 5-phosphate oxidase [Labrenzia sp. PHM005]